MRVEERQHHGWTKARTAPERPPSWVQFVVSFYTLKPQRGWSSKQDFTEASGGSQQVVKGNHPLRQLFCQVILFQVASEVMLVKKAVQAAP